MVQGTKNEADLSFDVVFEHFDQRLHEMQRSQADALEKVTSSVTVVASSSGAAMPPPGVFPTHSEGALFSGEGGADRFAILQR